MTSISGDRVEAASLRIRRLSVLPATLGLVAVAVLLIVARIVLDGEPAWPATAVVVAVAAVGATVATGFPVGLYVGLGVYAVAMVGGGLADRALSLAVATGTMMIAHELVRASLDARRPARFGPGIWFRAGGRTVVVLAAVATIAAFARWIGDTPLPTWLVPLGIAAAALPLVAHRFAGDWPAAVSVGLAFFLAFGAAVGAVAGATARSQIERSPTPITEAADFVPDTSTTTTVLPPVLPDPGTLEPLLTIALLGATLLIVGVILLALRRQEMAYDLDELDLDLDDSALGFTGPGRADVDDDLVAIDDETIDRLLADLALDMTAERDAGRAVRYAYANVERRLADLGVAPVDSETEQEFLLRAIPALGDDGLAMAELTTLFERARFGHVPVSEAMRHDALAAVERLRAATTPPHTGDRGNGR